MDRANVREELSLPNGLTNMKFFGSFFGQMTVECEEFFTSIRRMFQNHERAIIERDRIVGENVNDAGERGAQRRAGFDKKIDSKDTIMVRSG